MLTPQHGADRDGEHALRAGKNGVEISTADEAADESQLSNLGQVRRIGGKDVLLRRAAKTDMLIVESFLSFVTI
jgi:hypothetical protein